MPPKKGQKSKQLPLIRSLTTDDLIKIIDESGLSIMAIEKGIGMPGNTLHKVYNKIPDKHNDNYIRSLPVKWELPLLNYIKEKKALLQDHKEEIVEALEEVGVEITPIETEIEIPDLERKQNWITKLQEVKSEIEKDTD